MIVKVQVSTESADNNKHMLIYNMNKSILHKDDLSETVSNLMGSRKKAYFNAELVGDEIVLKHEVDPQPW